MPMNLVVPATGSICSGTVQPLLRRLLLCQAWVPGFLKDVTRMYDSVQAVIELLRSLISHSLT